MRLRFQYVSGLRLERTGPVAFGALLRPVAPVLVLAGDIGRPDRPGYAELLRWAARLWDHIVIIKGKSETMAAATMVVAEADPRIHFLEKGYTEIRNVSFVGYTNRHQTAMDLAICAEQEKSAVLVSYDMPPREYLRPPVRACIVGNAEVGRTWQLGGGGGGGGGIQLATNPWGARGYCRELFMDLTVPAVGGGSTADPLLRSASAEPPAEESACAPAPQRLA